MPIVQRSLLIDDEVWRRAKIAAATEGISVSEYCSRAILNAQPRLPGEPLMLRRQYAISSGVQEPPLSGEDAASIRTVFGLQVEGDPYMPEGVAAVVGEPRLDEEGNTVVPYAVILNLDTEPDANPFSGLREILDKPASVPSNEPFATLIKTPQDALNAVAEARRRKLQGS